MDNSDIGLSVSMPKTHGRISLDQSGARSEYTHKTTHKFWKDLLLTIGFFLIKFIVCLCLAFDLIALYGVLVNYYNFQTYQLAHILAGLYIALAVIFFWVKFNEVIE